MRKRALAASTILLAVLLAMINLFSIKGYADDEETKTIVNFHFEQAGVRYYGPGSDSDEIEGSKVTGKWGDGAAVLTWTKGVQNLQSGSATWRC